MNNTGAVRFVQALRASSETRDEGYEIFQYTRRYLRDTSAAFDSREATRPPPRSASTHQSTARSPSRRELRKKKL